MQPAFIVRQTANLVASYVYHNNIPRENLPDEIRRIYGALSALLNGAAQAPVPGRPTTAAIAASIRYDRLVSFIDGKAYKTLKRHLTANGMTPDEYRSRYGLASDYPMVSPGYAELRSRIAKGHQSNLKAG